MAYDDNAMTTCLQRFEKKLDLTPKQASNLLGIALPTYYQYRRTDEVPEHVRRYIKVILMLPERLQAALMKEYVFNAQTQ